MVLFCVNLNFYQGFPALDIQSRETHRKNYENPLHFGTPSIFYITGRIQGFLLKCCRDKSIARSHTFERQPISIIHNIPPMSGQFRSAKSVHGIVNEFQKSGT